MRLFERILFGLFIIWSAVGAVTLGLRQFALPPWISWADAFFMLLAAANVLLAMARRDGWPDTLKSFAIIAIGSGIVETVGATTGRPFGPYEYTPFFGPRIAGILPIAIPLAWYAVLGTGHYLVFHWLKLGSRRVNALAVAAWATAFDFVLEPFAAYVKSYWIWHTPDIPAQNYLAWFLVAFVLARLSPWGRGPIDRFDPRPAAVAASMLLIFAVGRIAAGV